jgi:hypothetical protein
MNNDLERRLDQVQLESEHFQMELVEVLATAKLRRVHVDGANTNVIVGKLITALEKVKRYLDRT